MVKPAPRSTETLPDSWASTAWSSKNAHASWVIGASGRPRDAYALPYTVVGVAHREDVRVRGVDRGMNHEARLVDGVVALDDRALMVDEDQVGQLDLREVHRHRVGPVELRVLGVADCQMTGEAEVEPPLGEGPAGGGRDAACGGREAPSGRCV